MPWFRASAASSAGATFFERELSEMFGITVVGTPNPDRLFLPDDWPTDAPPLRKDFIVPDPKRAGSRKQGSRQGLTHADT